MNAAVERTRVSERWSGEVPLWLYPPKLVVDENRWCPEPSTVEGDVYRSLPDEAKANPWQTAPLADTLTRAVMSGVASVASGGLLFSYGGGQRRYERPSVAIPHPDLLTVPYLWICTSDLMGDGQSDSLGVRALGDILRFAGNSDLYAYVPDYRRVVSAVATRVTDALTNTGVAFTTKYHDAERIRVWIPDDWPLVFPFWRSNALIVQGGETPSVEQATLSYMPSRPVAGCEITIQCVRPEANPDHESVVYDMLLVDPEGRPVAHAPKIFTNQFPPSHAAMMCDHRFGFVNARQSRRCIVFFGPHYLIGPQCDDTPFDTVPVGMPEDPALCYTTLLRMCAEIMHRAYGLPDDQARSVISQLAVQVRPSTDRLLEILCSDGSIAPEKQQEGLMQIIRWMTTRPNGFAFLLHTLGVGLLYPNAATAIEQLAHAWTEGHPRLLSSDAVYSSAVHTPTIRINNGRYNPPRSAIGDVVNFVVNELNMYELSGSSPIDAFAALWKPER